MGREKYLRQADRQTAEKLCREAKKKGKERKENREEEEKRRRKQYR